MLFRDVVPFSFRVLLDIEEDEGEKRRPDDGD
jgi:hypothetical protein